MGPWNELGPHINFIHREMRAAASNDAWRRLYRRRDFPIAEFTFRYTEVETLGSGQLRIKGPLALICGENGAGKTNLLRLIGRGLCEGTILSEDALQTLTPHLRTGLVSDFAATLQYEDGAKVETGDQTALWATLRATSETAGILIIETASIVPLLIDLIRDDVNFGDVLEGLAPKSLSREDLDEVNYLVGRDYESIEIFEVADYGNVERFPYFRVTAHGVTYGSEYMGMGELATLYLYWAVVDAPPCSVLLIEEPESFVAPRSQRCFVDWLATVVLEKRLFAVLSSHAGPIAERFPLPGVLLCTRTRGGVVVQPNPPAHILVERLGILSHRRCIVLVEDDAAEALADSLMLELDPRLRTECEIVPAGSCGAIDKALEALPYFNSDKFLLVGLYDGDQRNRERNQVSWPRIYLPGSEGPEQFLKDLVGHADRDEVVHRLGFSRDQFEAASEGAAGRDVHDWLRELCHSLRVHADFLYRRLVPLWIASHDEQARAFAGELSRAVRRAA